MIYYFKDDTNRITDTAHVMWGNPWGFKQVSDAEQLLTKRTGGKPGGGPQRDPRDFFRVFFTTIYTIVCCIAGFHIGDSLWGSKGAVLGFIVGIAVGLITGPRLVAYINKLRNKRWQRSVKKQDKYKGNNQGPIIR
jgi:hypothetical protein